jgi:hypothetical protein
MLHVVWENTLSILSEIMRERGRERKVELWTLVEHVSYLVPLTSLEPSADWTWSHSEDQRYHYKHIDKVVKFIDVFMNS